MAPSAPKLLVLQHIDCEPPGGYEDGSVARGGELVRVEIDDGETLPDWRGFDGIVAMGGPMGACEDQRLPWLVHERQLIADAVTGGVPFLGGCLGGALLG